MEKLIVNGLRRYHGEESTAVMKYLYFPACSGASSATNHTCNLDSSPCNL